MFLPLLYLKLYYRERSVTHFEPPGTLSTCVCLGPLTIKHLIYIFWSCVTVILVILPCGWLYSVFLIQDRPRSDGFHVVTARGETESSADHGAGTSHPQSSHLQGAVAVQGWFVVEICLFYGVHPVNLPRINPGTERETQAAREHRFDWCSAYVPLYILCVCLCVYLHRARVRKQECHPVFCRLCGLAAAPMDFLQRWPPWGTSTHRTSRWRPFDFVSASRSFYSRLNLFT